ncbi:MAG: alpha/beta hydrolase domain-containing protein [Burkholderiales bacterium]
MNTRKLLGAACIAALLAGWGGGAQAGGAWQDFGRLFSHRGPGHGHSASGHSHKVAGFIRQFEVLATGPAFGGATPPGAAGPYKYVAGIVHGELDPHNKLNAGIVDLDRAPVGADGYVAYSTNVVLLTPQNASDARRILFYDVVNRGNKLAAGSFVGAGSLTGAPPDAGFPSLLQYGYTVVWSGWQGDVALDDDPATVVSAAIGTSFPTAYGRHGTSITGLSREEFIPDYAGGPATQFKLSYPPASLTDTPDVTFTARQSWLTHYGADPAGNETYTAPAVPVTSWSYVDNGDGSYSVSFTPPPSVPGPNGTSVAPDAGTIYSFVYRAKDPRVNGIGFAAVRDLISFLRYSDADAEGTPNPLNFLKGAECADGVHCAKHPKSNVDIAIGEGISQSGRFTRDFLWQGFNEDVKGRTVFDGLIPIIAGSRKTYTNFEFSQPGRWSKQHEDHFQPGDQFPFAYNVIRDPVSGVTDGVFKKCLSSNTCPNVMQIDGAFEWWGARASLVVTDGAGHDLKLPKNVRYYVIPGARHGGGSGIGSGVYTVPAATDMCQLPNTDIAEAPVERALIVAMDRWLTHGTPPPPSQYPTVASGTLVSPAHVHFPDVSNLIVPSGASATSAPMSVNFTGLYNQLFVTDYSQAVPVVHSSLAYKVLVSQVDSNGNEVAGVPVPGVKVPIGSFLGWSLRGEGHAVGEGCAYAGGTIPFAVDSAAKTGGSDSRTTLAELYSGRADYQAKVAAQADLLVSQGYLLQPDADNVYKANSLAISPNLIPSP